MANIRLSDGEHEYLRELCQCADGKGIPVHRDDKRIVSALVRKGLAWTLSSVFTVAIATNAGRALIRQKAA